jgi:hypothetical protein
MNVCMCVYADRRDTLQALEKQLQAIDRARRAKKEELRDLERKLVVLLEEQQAELAAIKKRQEKSSTRMIPDLVSDVKRELASRGGNRSRSGRKALEDDAAAEHVATEGNGYGPTPQQVTNSVCACVCVCVCPHRVEHKRTHTLHHMFVATLWVGSCDVHACEQ